MRDELIPRPAGWRYGPRRRWMLPSEGELWSRLESLRPPLLFDPRGMRPSAVLIGLSPTSDGPSILITKRSMLLRHHPGELSFPGGRVDEGETIVEAAVREANEEVGLRSHDIHVFGATPHHRTTVSRSHIIPIVARLERSGALQLNPTEVDAVAEVPLAHLTEPDRYHTEIWARGGEVHVLHFFDVDELGDEVLWGATAHMLAGLFDVLVSTPLQ